MKKYDLVSAMAEHTAKEVVKNEETWKKYLNTASRMYKYPFRDQLLIYAQRPEATACASLEIWNEKMHCWVNRGAKGIALIDEEGHKFSKLRYVFDISDVHKAKRIGKFPYLWEMQETQEERVLERLERIYGETDKETGFVDRIRELSVRITEECYPEILQDLEYLKEGSFLEELDELNLSVRLRVTLADSIAYTVLRRCGVPESLLADEMSFPYIHEFNTVETLSQVGSYVSDFARPILMEIGKVIWTQEKEASQNLEQKGLEKTDKHDYNALKRKSEEQNKQDKGPIAEYGERSSENETTIRTERGLSDSDVTNGQTAGGNIDQIRADEKELLTGTQERDLHGTVTKRDTERTSSDHTEPGGREDGISDGTDEERSGRDRADERGKSDALGTENEQHSARSRGSRSEGIDLQLNRKEPESGYQQLSLFPSVEEQIGNITAAQASMKYTMPAAFFLPQDQLDDILRSGGGRVQSRKRIYAKYQQRKTPEEMAEFLKNEYETTGKGFEFDSNPVSLWFDEAGMRIGYGMSAKENPLVFMNWS